MCTRREGAEEAPAGLRGFRGKARPAFGLVATEGGGATGAIKRVLSLNPAAHTRARTRTHAQTEESKDRFLLVFPG